jgi:mannose/cellobiose epimerase-like protein (N-acyl-D-glucosamine 2-epimerase family)
MIPTREDFAKHRESICRFWERARDNKDGGFHIWIGPDGTVWNHRHRALLIQARLLYNYSEGIRAGLDFCASHAEHLYKFITTNMRTPGGWYGGIYEGTLRSPEILDAYDNLFVVIGMARYAMASGRADVAEETWRLFQTIEKVTVKSELAVGGIVGGMSRMMHRSTSTESFSGNNNLHYLEALVCMRDAGIGGDPTERAKAMREFFYARILDKEHMVVFDRFQSSYEQPWRGVGAHTSLAHGLEWIDFFRCMPGAHLDEKTERALYTMAMDHGVRPSGLFQDSYYIHEGKSAKGGMFWPQVESVKSFNLATQIYDSSYKETCLKLAQYYFEHFIDTDGGVFSEIDRNGVVTDRTKGGYWKCDYHSMRMCVDAIERQGGAFA